MENINKATATVTDNKISLSEFDRQLVAGTSNVDAVEFSFNDTWDGLTIYAVFACGREATAVYIEDGDTVNIPWEVMVPGYLRLTAVGYDKDMNEVIRTSFMDDGPRVMDSGDGLRGKHAERTVDVVMLAEQRLDELEEQIPDAVAATASANSAATAATSAAQDAENAASDARLYGQQAVSAAQRADTATGYARGAADSADEAAARAHESADDAMEATEEARELNSASASQIDSARNNENARQNTFNNVMVELRGAVEQAVSAAQRVDTSIGYARGAADSATSAAASATSAATAANTKAALADSKAALASTAAANADAKAALANSAATAANTAKDAANTAANLANTKAGLAADAAENANGAAASAMELAGEAQALIDSSSAALLSGEIAELKNSEKKTRLELSSMNFPIIANIGYINYDVGIVDTNTSGYAGSTDFIDVSGCDKFETYTNMGSAGCAIALYDSDKAYIKSLSVAGIAGRRAYEVDLADNAYSSVRYARVSYYDASAVYSGFYAKASKNGNISSMVSALDGRVTALESRHYNTFSVIGDSYSSFAGYMADDAAATWYPASSHGNDDTNDVENVEQTWWYKFANSYGSRLVENDSWSGSTISYDGYGDGTSDGRETSFVTRRDKLTNPELIVVFGGTNDVWVNNDNGGGTAFLGGFIYDGWTDADLEKFRPALSYLLHNLKREHVGAKIVFVQNTNIDIIGYSVDTICGHYGVSVLKLENITKAHSHPTEAGMTAISNQMKAFLEAGN